MIPSPRLTKRMQQLTITLLGRARVVASTAGKGTRASRVCAQLMGAAVLLIVISSETFGENPFASPSSRMPFASPEPYIPIRLEGFFDLLVWLPFGWIGVTAVVLSPALLFARRNIWRAVRAAAIAVHQVLWREKLWLVLEAWILALPIRAVVGEVVGYRIDEVYKSITGCVISAILIVSFIISRFFSRITVMALCGCVLLVVMIYFALVVASDYLNEYALYQERVTTGRVLNGPLGYACTSPQFIKADIVAMVCLGFMLARSRSAFWIRSLVILQLILFVGMVGGVRIEWLDMMPHHFALLVAIAVFLPFAFAAIYFPYHRRLELFWAFKRLPKLNGAPSRTGQEVEL